MSIKVEQFKAPQGTKIYLVDPASLRLKLNQQNLLGKTQHLNNSITNGSTGSSNGAIPGESSNQKKVSKGVHERKHRKRKATIDEIGLDDEDDITNRIGTKETTTRTGRISKISKGFDPKGTTVSSNTSEMTTVKVKKREPASVFRCPVCQKVYIGYVKLKLHFRKFPDHYNYGNVTTTTATTSSSSTTTTAGAVNNSIISNFSNQNIPSVLQQLKKCNPVSLSTSSSSFTTSNSSKVEVSHIETQTETDFGSMEREKIIISSHDSQAQNVLVTQQSQSTNGLNIIERLNSLNPPAYTFTTSTNTSTSSTTNGFCVNSNNNNNNNNSSSHDFNHYRSNHNNNGNIRNHNNFNNNNNNINSSNNNNTLHLNQELDGHIFDDTLRLLLHSPPLHLINNNSHSSSSSNNNNNTNSCMTSAMIYQNNSNNHNNNHLNGASPTTTNRQSNILSALSPSNVMMRHNNNNHNHSNNSHLQNETHHHQNGNSPSQKRVWDVLEEKLIHQGINEILLELTDVAEKLAKIARDKIIPIREEEEEQLRINASVPIVQVDSPFLSHLLDLPLGTYYYKEDAGRRPLLPPPISAELSLTGETELISKFLTPDIDLINLPHLTNIDVFLQ